MVKGGLSQVGCPFLGGLRSEWMKSGHGGRGGQKRPKMGGRPLYTVPLLWLIRLGLPYLTAIAIAVVEFVSAHGIFCVTFIRRSCSKTKGICKL